MYFLYHKHISIYSCGSIVLAQANSNDSFIIVSVYTLSRSFVCVEGLSACIQCILYADPGKTWSPMSPGIDILPSLGVTLASSQLEA